MTKQKSFKTRVRTRMAKTGESYTAARRQLITRSSEQAVADDSVAARTGRTREQWFALLDRWDAHTRPHPEIARWLVQTHGVPGWWAQNITVAYEQARGLRKPGQRRSGEYATSASKTVGAAAERVTEAFTDPRLRERWLPGVDLEVRAVRPGKSVRALWPGGRARVNVGLVVKGPDKTAISVQLEKLPDAEAMAELRALWRERLVDLKKVLES